MVWPSNGFTLSAGVSLELSSSSPDSGLLDLGMDRGLISAMGPENTVRINNLTLVNLCSAIDVLPVKDYMFDNVTLTTALLVNSILRRPNIGPQSLVVSDSVMYVPRRELQYIAYW